MTSPGGRHRYSPAPPRGLPPAGGHGLPPFFPPTGGYDYGPGPGRGVAPRDHPEGNSVLVLGVLGLLLCALISPFVWSKGNRVLADIDNNPDIFTNRGSVQAGRILGMIGSFMLGMTAMVLVLAIITLIIAAASAPPS